MPVRTRNRIPLITLRWSFHCPPRRPIAGKCGSSRTHSAFVRSPRPMPGTTSQQTDSHMIRRTGPSPNDVRESRSQPANASWRLIRVLSMSKKASLGTRRKQANTTDSVPVGATAAPIREATAGSVHRPTRTAAGFEYHPLQRHWVPRPAPDLNDRPLVDRLCHGKRTTSANSAQEGRAIRRRRTYTTDIHDASRARTSKAWASCRSSRRR